MNENRIANLKKYLDKTLERKNKLEEELLDCNVIIDQVTRSLAYHGASEEAVESEHPNDRMNEYESWQKYYKEWDEFDAKVADLEGQILERLNEVDRFVVFNQLVNKVFEVAKGNGVDDRKFGAKVMELVLEVMKKEERKQNEN